MKLYSNRAGNLYHVQSNYDCFVPKSLYEMEDTNFYWIFHLLIVMKNNNLLHYLDYILSYLL